MKLQTGIVHLRVLERQSLKSFLLRIDLSELSVAITPSLVDEWLHFGSVYVEGLRQREDVELEAQQIVRLHTRRKSYVTLEPKIVFEDEEIMIVDKPAGLPTHPTLDNFLENAQFILSAKLGRKLFVTHRLDTVTQGLLVLAKTPEAQALVNKCFAKGRVEKIYRARTGRDLPLGLYTHYMDPESRIPKVVQVEPRADWWECRLEILKSQQGVQTIRLLTGKTHQIRSQLSALGCPIVGDVAYGSQVAYDNPLGIALECYSLKFPFRLKKVEIERDR